MQSVTTPHDPAHDYRRNPPSKTPGWPAQQSTPHPRRSDEFLYDADDGPANASPPPASNLGPLEKSVENPHGISSDLRELLASAHHPSMDQRFRFGSTLPERMRWLDILPAVEERSRTIARFAQCGNLAYLEWNTESREYRVRSNKCKLRICPACRRAMQTKYAARIRQVVGRVGKREWQHITLTMKHTDEPLAEQIKFLRSCFRKLRHRSQWKRSVEHGYAVLEINWNNERQEWHPHLHVLAKTRFIDYSELRRDWFQVTRGSNNIHARFIEANDSAADYAAKYLGKPPSLEMMTNPERMKEYYKAIKSARLLMPFGFNSKLPDAPKSNAPIDAWISKGSIAQLIARIANADFVILSEIDCIYRERRDIALKLLRYANAEPTLYIAECEAEQTTDQHSLAMPAPP